MKTAIATFDANLTAKRENRDDVSEIVRAADDVDGFLDATDQSKKLKNDWIAIRGLVDRLAASYGLQTTVSGGAHILQLHPIATAVCRRYARRTTPLIFLNANASMTPVLPAHISLTRPEVKIPPTFFPIRASRAAINRISNQSLRSPEQVAIRVRGDQITLASSKASPVTITADGREKTENTGGKTVRLRATLRGDELTVSSLGGETDYTVTFTSADGGKTLKVTRRITTNYLRETVFAESIYNRTDAVAQLGIDNDDSGPVADDTYSSNDPNDVNAPNPGGPSIVQSARIGEFIVPNGEIISGILENPID